MNGNLNATDLEMFARLGIPVDLVNEAQVERVTDAEARAKYGITAKGDMAGIVFPYFDPIDGRRMTARLRRDHPEVENGKARNKYISAYGDRRHLYFPPGAAELLKDASIPSVLVEAEKSALALTALFRRTGRKCLSPALGGVWGWRGRIGKKETSGGWRVNETGPLPDLDYINGREAIVLFDTNTQTDPQVRHARFAFARELVRRDCQVRIADLPEVEAVNGPDDCIGICGDAIMLSVIDAARVYTDVALSQAQALAETLEKNPQIDPRELQACFETLAAVDGQEQRQLFIGRISKALGRQLRKSYIEAAVERLRTGHAKARASIDENAKVAELTNLQIRPVELVAALEKYFSERAHLPEGAALTLAFFTMNTYVFDVFDTTPYLNLESNVPGCGKTTVVSLLRVAARCMETRALTEATMFRMIAETAPTLLIDEAEFLRRNSERAEMLRAMAQAGYKRSAKVPRCEGDDHKLRYFDVYGPKVFALIGGLEGPLLDRSIILHMEKRPRDRTWKSCRERVLEREAKPLRKQLEAYALQARKHLAELYDAEPDEGYWPDLVDREAEIFGPLLIHARLIGPEIEERLLQAAKLLSGQKAQAQGQEKHTALAVELIAVLKENAGERFAPADILSQLEKCEQWASKLRKYKDQQSRCAAIGQFFGRFKLKSKHCKTGSSYLRQEVLDTLLALTGSGPKGCEASVTAPVTTSVTAEEIEKMALTEAGDTGDRGDSQIGGGKWGK